MLLTFKMKPASQCVTLLLPIWNSSHDDSCKWSFFAFCYKSSTHTLVATAAEASRTTWGSCERPAVSFSCVEALAQDPICADFRLKGIHFLQPENWNICCNNERFLESVQLHPGWWDCAVRTLEDFTCGTHLLDKDRHEDMATRPLYPKRQKSVPSSVCIMSISACRLLLLLKSSVRSLRVKETELSRQNCSI